MLLEHLQRACVVLPPLARIARRAQLLIKVVVGDLHIFMDTSRLACFMDEGSAGGGESSAVSFPDGAVGDVAGRVSRLSGSAGFGFSTGGFCFAVRLLPEHHFAICRPAASFSATPAGKAG